MPAGQFSWVGDDWGNATLRNLAGIPDSLREITHGSGRVNSWIALSLTPKSIHQKKGEGTFCAEDRGIK